MAKKSRAPDEFDNPWKGTLQLFLRHFLEYFFPDIATDIDWSRSYESLDKELQKIARRAKIGDRLADKLFKVWLKDGGEHWLLIHIEVQSDFDTEFAERMFHYNVAARQMYNRDVISLAVLADENPKWRPVSFSYGKWGCKTEIIFRIAKLLDHADDEAMLECSDNPFAAVVLAHAKARETRNDPVTRKYWKLRMVKGLYERNWSKEMIVQLFLVIDFMMSLPHELDRLFEIDFSAFEEERKVRYVSSIERVRIEKGREQGRKEGLIEGVALLLDAKFGKPGLALLPKVEALSGLAEIRKFSRLLKKAQTLDDVRDYFI